MSLQTFAVLGLLMIVSCYLISQLLKTLFELLAKVSSFVAIGFLVIFFFALNRDVIDKEITFFTNLNSRPNVEIPTDDLVLADFNPKDENTIDTKLLIDQTNKTIIENQNHFKNTSNQNQNNNPRNDLSEVVQFESFTNPSSTLYCDQFDLPTPRFVLIESFFAEETNAINRVEFLKAKGFGFVQYVWLPCYKLADNKNLYAVILGKTCRMEETILEKQSKYERKAKKMGINLISNTYKFLETSNQSTNF